MSIVVLIICAVGAIAALLFIYRDIIQPGGETTRGIFALAMLLAIVIVAFGQSLVIADAMKFR